MSEHLSREKKEADVGRSSEDIRRNIAKEKENISQKVDQIGDRIKEKLDWRQYVKESTYLSIGVAAGLGYIGSRILITRKTPMERMIDSIAGEVRGTLAGQSEGPGLIKLTLLAIATNAADRWIKNLSSTEEVNGAAGRRPRAGHGSTVGPKAGNKHQNQTSPSSWEGLERRKESFH